MTDKPRIVEFVNGEQVTRDMTAEEIAALLQPEPAHVPQSVSRRQAIKALRVAGVITPEESVAWTKDNILPPFITEYLDMLPPDDLADAYEDLIAATEYHIDAPMVSLLGYAAGINKSEKENLFRLASTF